MKTLDDVKLVDVLPDSISKDKNMNAAAEAVDKQLRKVAEKVDIGSLLANIDILPSLVLDHMAVQNDVSVWRDSWSISLKRSVLKAALADKRKKGTRGAVLKALKSIGSSATIVEWWQTTPKGEPHTFKIYATLSKMDGVISDELQEDLIKQIDDAKPLRSHYDLILSTTLDGGVGVCGCMRAITVARL